MPGKKERVLSQVSLPIATRFDEIKGKEAWRENIRLSNLVHSRIKSTLGPKGAYKMVTYNRGPEQVVKISKDVIPILDEIGYQYPAVKIICEAAKMQRTEDGDGTTQFSLLLTAILMEADKLIVMGVHPNVVLKGFSEATKRAIEVVELLSTSVDDEKEWLLDCVDCGRGILTPKLRNMIFEASRVVIRDNKLDETRLTFLRKVGGYVDETRYIKGVALKSCKVHQSMPNGREVPRLAVLSGTIGSNRHSTMMKKDGPPEIEIAIKKPMHVSGFLQAERDMKLAQIFRLRELGVDTLLCGQIIDDSIKGELARQNIYALEKVEQTVLISTAKATGAKVVSDIGDLRESDLGRAENLVTEWIEPERITFFEGCEAATFLLRGSTQQTIDEVEQTIRNSLNVLAVLKKDSRIVPGGGALEMHIAEDLRRHALKYPNKEQIAIERYADAVGTIPKILAENFGFEPVDIIAELGKYHQEDSSYGIGKHGCASNVCGEPTRVKLDIFRRAMDVAQLVLSINEMWVSKEIVRVHKQ